VKINPLYIALLLFALLATVIYQLSISKEQLRESKITLHETEMMAQEIQALRRSWDQPKSSKTALLRLLNASQLKPANIQKSVKRSIIVLSSKKADLKTTNYFFVKLFNGAFRLKKFNVKRLDKEHVSFSVEVAL